MLFSVQEQQLLIMRCILYSRIIHNKQHICRADLTFIRKIVLLLFPVLQFSFSSQFSLIPRSTNTTRAGRVVAPLL